jgi:hypothetical protein
LTKTSRDSVQPAQTAPTEPLLWVPLEPIQRGINDEVRVTRTLVQYGFRAIARGGRRESFDLEVLEAPSHWPVELGPRVGRFEVKKLSRSGKTRWDPRFKTSGARGSRIYGRHSALIKAAALELEDNLRYLDLDQWTNEETDYGDVHRCFRMMLEDAFSDRHSHRFRNAFDAVCRDVSPKWHLPYVNRYLNSPLTIDKIMSGYSDLDGLFIIRGDTYTLIKRDEISQRIAFDSFGSEGLKLRISSVIVSDDNSVVGKFEGRDR